MTTAVFCGLQAIRANRLLAAAIWLAGVSLLVSTALYRMGAAETAVIELSVGAGLVTVLFVFAIAIAGEEAMTASSLVPGPLVWLLLVVLVVLLGWLTAPVQLTSAAVSEEAPFAVVLWEERGLDMLVQVGLIFAGALGILGLLSEPQLEQKPPVKIAVSNRKAIETGLEMVRLDTVRPIVTDLDMVRVERIVEKEKEFV
jgi:uncharacterized MnhB-related membrane protein